MNKHHILLPLLLISCAAIAGIYRHDKKESEYVALGAQPQFDCVGQVLLSGQMQASCVLIGDRYVLSAAHVFVQSDHRERKINNNGVLITVNEPYNKHIGNAADYSVVFNGRQYKCKKLTVYPHYLDSATQDWLDIALMELEEPVPGITPAILNTAYDELHTNVTGVGWGVRGRADKPSEIVRKDPKKLAGENVVVENP